MIINIRTGELLDFSTWTEEEIVEELRDLEDLLKLAIEARFHAKSALLSRMEQAGATLLPTSAATVKVKMRPGKPTQRMVDDLYTVCPDEFKNECFKAELKPMKRGLNKLAKLGTKWQQMVDALYQETPVLDIEWAPKLDEHHKPGETRDIPF